MIQLVIKDGLVIATHAIDQKIHDLYPNADEIVDWDGPTLLPGPGDLRLPIDPRDQTRKDQDRNTAHIRQRRAKYPRFEEIVSMLRDDLKNGTNTLVAHIDTIDAQNPERTIR